MAHKTMIAGTAYAVTGGKTLAGGTAYSVSKGITLIGGTEYTIPFISGKTLAEYAEGDVVYLSEGGILVPFYVACHNYESGLNGSGRTLVVRKDCYDTRAWHSSNVNAWASCTLRSWLNGDYLNLLDEDIRGVIGTTKYYYTPGNGTTSVTTRSDAVFQLSVTELGKTATYANAEGTALPIASTLQIAYRNGSAVNQWTRSPNTSSTGSAYYLDTYGSVYNINSVRAGTYGSRPAFTLPDTAAFDPDTNVLIAA